MDKFLAITASSSFAPVFVFILTVAGISVLVWYLQQKRKKDLAAMCLNGGFEFDEQAVSLSGLPVLKVSSPAASPEYSVSSGFAAIGGGDLSAGRSGQPGTAAPDPYLNDPIYKKTDFGAPCSPMTALRSPIPSSVFLIQAAPGGPPTSSWCLLSAGKFSFSITGILPAGANIPIPIISLWP
ncbi:MAG: hypothetical protein COT17_00185 [Elusimicrobia bacterium CG08_land_8_20_14_0_20_51_18]|nr:MAG: hypothetical protein COT17_00185 [Elusimicrobia bacterium CG08_land_8_20_14_0_20_51_18]